MTVQHQPACVAYRARQETARVAYVATYPTYCRSCGGVGGSSYTENVGERNYPINETFFDTCADCTDKGICARCGEHVAADVDYSIEHPCSSCGFATERDGGIPIVDCICDPFDGVELDVDPPTSEGGAR